MPIEMLVPYGEENEPKILSAAQEILEQEKSQLETKIKIHHRQAVAAVALMCGSLFAGLESEQEGGTYLQQSFEYLGASPEFTLIVNFIALHYEEMVLKSLHDDLKRLRLPRLKKSESYGAE